MNSMTPKNLVGVASSHDVYAPLSIHGTPLLSNMIWAYETASISLIQIRQ